MSSQPRPDPTRRPSTRPSSRSSQRCRAGRHGQRVARLRHGPSPGHPGQRLRGAAGARPRVRRRDAGPADPASRAWSSCARTTWSASSTTSPRSGPAGDDARDPEATRDRLLSGADSERGGAQGRPGAAGHAGHPRRHGRRPTGPGIVMTIDDPDHKVTAPGAARRPAGAAGRRRRGGPDRRRARVVAEHLLRATCRRASRSTGSTVGAPYGSRRSVRPPTMASAMEIPGWCQRDRRASYGATVADRAGPDASPSPRCTRLDDASLRSARSRTPSQPRDDRRRPRCTTRSSMSELDYPQDLRYTAEHEWVRTGDDGVVRVGHHLLRPGRPRRRRLRQPAAVGDTLAAGDACGEVESTKSVSDLYAPLSGRGHRRQRGPGRRRPSWSTPTPTARAGCTSCAWPTGCPVDALLDADGLPGPARLRLRSPHRTHEVRGGARWLCQVGVTSSSPHLGLGTRPGEGRGRGAGALMTENGQDQVPDRAGEPTTMRFQGIGEPGRSTPAPRPRRTCPAPTRPPSTRCAPAPPCWWSCAAPTPVRGSCWTPTRSAPGATPTATSSSTT